MIVSMMYTMQECSSSQELQISLRQVEKMLVAHEASYQQNLRSLRKRLSALQNSTRQASALATPLTTPLATPLATPHRAGERVSWQ